MPPTDGPYRQALSPQPRLTTKENRIGNTSVSPSTATFMPQVNVPCPAPHRCDIIVHTRHKTHSVLFGAEHMRTEEAYPGESICPCRAAAHE